MKKERKKKKRYDFAKFNRDHPILDCFLHRLCVLLSNRGRYDREPMKKIEINDEDAIV